MFTQIDFHIRELDSDRHRVRYFPPMTITADISIFQRDGYTKMIMEEKSPRGYAQAF